MKATTLSAAAVAAAAFFAAPSLAHATIVFSDDFEAAGPAGTVLGSPNWLVNGTDLDDGDPPTALRAFSADNTSGPFVSGLLHADLIDNRSDLGQRLISTNLNSSINGVVSTYSFDVFRPSGVTQSGGFIFGYSSGAELNGGARKYSAEFVDGMVQSRDSSVPASIGIPFDQVHRVYLVVNDSVGDLANYAAGQTLEAGTADVWVSLNGQAPVFGFEVLEELGGSDVNHVGFRSFNGSLHSTLVDNVVVETGIAASLLIPEPASGVVGLAAVAGGLALRRRRD